VRQSLMSAPSLVRNGIFGCGDRVTEFPARKNGPPEETKRTGWGSWEFGPVHLRGSHGIQITWTRHQEPIV
jgi:hypothetical protein